MATFERHLAAPPPPPARSTGGSAASSPTASLDHGDSAPHEHRQAAVRDSQRQQQQQAQALAPQHMDAVLSALVALRAAPDPSWLYVFCRQLGGQLAARPVPAPTLISIASSLAALNYRMPDHLSNHFERAVTAALPTLAPRDLLAALRALGALRARPSDAWIGALFRRLLLSSCHVSAPSVAALLATAAALGYQLQHDWVELLLMQARGALGGLSPHEHVGLIDALAAQRYRPGPGFMEEFMQPLGAHLPRLGFGQLAALLAGLAAAAYKPPPQWMRACMVAAVSAPAGADDAQQLLRMLGALKRMQYTPTGDILAGLESRVAAAAAGADHRATQQLRAALAALEYIPQTAAAAAAAAAAPAAVGHDEEGTARAAPAGLPEAATEFAAQGASEDSLLDSVDEEDEGVGGDWEARGATDVRRGGRGQGGRGLWQGADPRGVEEMPAAAAEGGVRAGQAPAQPLEVWS
jgi:hypothetical protein